MRPRNWQVAKSHRQSLAASRVCNVANGPILGHRLNCGVVLPVRAHAAALSTRPVIWRSTVNVAPPLRRRVSSHSGRWTKRQSSR